MAWAKELSSLQWEGERENCKKQVLFPGRWHKEPGPMCCPGRRMGESSLMQAGLTVTFLIVFWTLPGHVRALAGFVSPLLLKVPWRVPRLSLESRGSQSSKVISSLFLVMGFFSSFRNSDFVGAWSDLFPSWWMKVTFSDSWPSLVLESVSLASVSTLLRQGQLH